MLKRLSLLALVTLAACGSPQAGDSCSPENSATCESTTTGLYCESGHLRAVECRGPSGCSSNASTVTCDFSRARAGDACPKANEAQAVCDAGNANQGLVCTSGTWQTRACTACSVQGGTVVCQQ